MQKRTFVGPWEIRSARLADGRLHTIHIEGTRIIAVDQESTPANYIEASGLLVMPGFINTHVHGRTPGQPEKEDWCHLSRAALLGGFTSVCDEPNNNEAIETDELFEKKLAAIGQQPIGAHFWFAGTPKSIPYFKYVAGNPRCCGIKLYMEETTGNIKVTNPADQRAVLRAAAEHGLLVQVHVGDQDMIEHNLAQMRRTRQPLIADHCIIRSWEIELAGARAILQMAMEEEARILLAHTSVPEVVEAAMNAKFAGQDVSVEFSPQYLIFDGSYLARPDGWRFKCNPALRTRAQVQRMQQFLLDPDAVDVIGDDHAPHESKVDPESKPLPYDTCPSGMPGLQPTATVVYHLIRRGVLGYEFPRGHFERIMSENAARILKLPTKGKIEAGYDADLVLFDPRLSALFCDEDVASKCGWTPFRTWVFLGKAKYTVANGVLYEL